MLEPGRNRWRYRLIGFFAVAAVLYGAWTWDAQASMTVHATEAQAVPTESITTEAIADRQITEPIQLSSPELGTVLEPAAAVSMPEAAEPLSQLPAQTQTAAVQESAPAVQEPVLHTPIPEPVPAVQTAKVEPAGKAIVQSLQQKGTPSANYKVSEVDEDIVLDAAAMTVGPEPKKAAEAKSGAAATEQPAKAAKEKTPVRRK